MASSMQGHERSYRFISTTRDFLSTSPTSTSSVHPTPNAEALKDSRRHRLKTRLPRSHPLPLFISSQQKLFL
eukprot:scaffold84860_cov24-Tisochrysis_lutea.AAC.1